MDIVFGPGPGYFGQGGGTLFDTFMMIMFFIDHVLVPLIFAIAFIVFIFGVFRYFIAGGADEEKRAQGKQLVLWGLIGFVIMIAVWGLVNLIANSLGLDARARPIIPTSGALEQSGGDFKRFR